jgi:MFS transporter, MHS family, proline/betaine transporter
MSRKKVVAAGFAGNILEWYDFGVYGYFATVFARHFFPSEDPAISLISSFGAFAVGFVMRPVGSVIFGYIGDRLGRKAALTHSVLMMAIPTFLMGLLPTYENIGIWAPILLILLRMVQGISVGGEYTSSIVYLSESAPDGKRGLFSSLALTGAFVGIMLGSFVGAVIMSVYTDEQVYNFAWRIPFLIGIVLALFIMYLRKGMPETLSVEEKAPSLVKTLHDHWKSVLRVVFLNVLNAISFYTLFVFLSSWFVEYKQVDHAVILEINTLAMAVLVIGSPFWGWLSDRTGRKPILVATSAIMALFAYPMLMWMSSGGLTPIIIGQIFFAVVLSGYMGPTTAFLTEMFPKNIRVSAVGIGYNLSYAIFGGTAPMLALWLMMSLDDHSSFVWLIVAASTVSFVTALFSKESAHHQLLD